ncbi:hypothetical protein [Novipirellula artificiosorum]|uniref:Uncharacterized protein n=1 Tax=Novipirellula artificiosorum TaxID=2528016 RepID=A0A5C6D393_9BACT|nr:hypothetical protein [Novipirellula artificiosorum]TWU30585.1 hypothetical protein Poly41_66800 [Novipirellula artificiosorum]
MSIRLLREGEQVDELQIKTGNESQASPEGLTELLLDAGGGHRRNWQDSTLPTLLQWANPRTSYFQLLADVLDEADTSEQGRILQYVCARRDVSGGAIKPLVQWIVKNAPLKERQDTIELSRLPDAFSTPRIHQEFFVPAKIRLADRPNEFMETLSLAYLAASTCTVEDRTKCFELLRDLSIPK